MAVKCKWTFPEFSKPGLLVIDAQEKYRSRLLTFTTATLAHMRAVIGHCASTGMDVYWTEFDRDPKKGAAARYYAGQGGDAIYGVAAGKSSVVEELKPKRFGFSKKNVFPTERLSSFTNDALAKELSKHDLLIIIGGWTDQCVTATAHAAFARNISVCVVEDACFALRYAQQHDHAISVLGHSIAKIVSTKELLQATQ